MLENVPVLLQCTRDGDRVVLRIDIDFLCGAPTVAEPVEIVTLVACAGVEAVHGLLNTALGQHIHIDTSTEGDRVQVHAYIDYGNDPGDITCANVIRARESYSAEDLVRKSRFLSEGMQRYAQSHESTYAQLCRLRERLTTEINKEVDRATRKKEHFEAHADSRAARYEGQVEAYAHVRAVLQRFDDEERVRAQSRWFAG
jgi:hypothetical protein